jgi:hypothetical protein
MVGVKKVITYGSRCTGLAAGVTSETSLLIAMARNEIHSVTLLRRHPRKKFTGCSTHLNASGWGKNGHELSPGWGVTDLDAWVLDVAREQCRSAWSPTTLEGTNMGRGILLWLVGIPIPIIILLALFWH